jgi:effector-binding domain-containing protein
MSRDTGVPGPELASLDPAVTAVIRGNVPVAGLRDFYDAAFRALPQVLAAQGLSMVSPAFALYHGIPGETFDLEVGFVTDRPVQAVGGVAAGSLPGGPVGRLTHLGPFDDLAASWVRLHDWIRDQGLTPLPHRWETYVTRPTPAVDPHDLRTELTWPVSR